MQAQDYDRTAAALGWGPCQLEGQPVKTDCKFRKSKAGEKGHVDGKWKAVPLYCGY